MSFPAQAALEELYTALEQTQTSNYIAISAITFMIYEIISKFDMEVKYIWMSKWSIPKVLYIFGRYYGVLHTIVAFVVSTRTQLSVKFCQGWFWYLIMGGDIVFSTVVNIILSIRLNAMYQKTTVLVFLLTIFAGEFSVELYVSVKAAISTEHAVFPAPVDIWPGCVSNPDTHFTLISWIPTLVIQFIFFLLTIAKLFDDGRWKPSFLKEMATLSPLFVAFIRDGSVFFFLIFAIVLASALCSLLVKGPLLNMVQPWLTAIYSFSVSRLVLNIRELAHRGNMDTNGSSLARRTAPPLVFAHGRSGDSVGQEESEAQVADEHELELGIFSDAVRTPGPDESTSC